MKKDSESWYVKCQQDAHVDTCWSVQSFMNYIGVFHQGKE